MKKYLASLFFLTTFSYAEVDTNVFIGLGPGYYSQDFTINNTEKEQSYAGLNVQLGLLIADRHKLYFGTFSNDNDEIFSSFFYINYDFILNTSSNIEPIIGMSFLKSEYDSTIDTNKVNITSDSVGLRAGAYYRANDYFQFETSITYYISNGDPEIDNSLYTIDQSNSYLLYTGITMSLDTFIDIVDFFSSFE